MLSPEKTQLSCVNLKADSATCAVRSATCRQLCSSLPPRLLTVPRRGNLHPNQPARPVTPDPKDPPLTSKAQKPAPFVEPARIRPVELLAPPPVWARAWRPCAPRTTLAIRAQSCTNESSPQRRDLRITPTNYYYLDKIGFDPQKPRAAGAILCIQPTPSQKPNSGKSRNLPLGNASHSQPRAETTKPQSLSRRTRGTLLPSRPAALRVFRVHSRPNVFRDSCTVMHKPSQRTCPVYCP